MFSALLVIIYISFISLGLPDSLLGSAWPSMYGQLGVPISYAGIISMIIAGGTIISSLFSNKLIRKFGTGFVTAVSVCMTAVALFGFSISHSFILLCVFAIPYGLGAGSVDAALNNFVALHYESKHMSWLHCFWGVGVTIGPYIMGLCLTRGLTWNSGYRTISVMQIVLTTILFCSLPLWKTNSEKDNQDEVTHKSLSMKDLIKIPGAKPALLAFFCYCALEVTAGLWASSYMFLSKGISAVIAAKWTSIFYFGITFGRFLSGFITTKLGDQKMVRLGQSIACIGIIIILLPLGNISVLIGLIMVGMGCAPIYPSLLHETPENFGADLSQSIMGMQMACAYVGATFMPPLFGFIAERISIKLYPFFLMLFVLIMIIMVERLNKLMKDRRKNSSQL